jgi:hypothetical protein
MYKRRPLSINRSPLIPWRHISRTYRPFSPFQHFSISLPYKMIPAIPGVKASGGYRVRTDAFFHRGCIEVIGEGKRQRYFMNNPG